MGGHVVILLTARLTENIDLDLAGVLCEATRRNGDAAGQSKGLQKADRERS